MNRQRIETPLRTSLSFVTQSTPKHVAIIMDGNRRWAKDRGRPATAGQRKGVQRLEALLPMVRNTGIETLTLFGFASANWGRSEMEVSHLMRLAEEALERFMPRCVTEGLAVEVIGRKDRLPESLVDAIERCQRSTAGGGRLLRIALDYSSREAILNAARTLEADAGPDSFTRLLGSPADVDLLIRTGREQRLSDFLLWECAFAELYFPDLYWPEFQPADLLAALDWYGQRQRRFGQ